MYRLKIATHVYMKLRVPDNLVLFLYHSGIYIYIYTYIYIIYVHIHLYIFIHIGWSERASSPRPLKSVLRLYSIGLSYQKFDSHLQITFYSYLIITLAQRLLSFQPLTLTFFIKLLMYI